LQPSHSSSGAAEPAPNHDPHSSFKLEIAISVGYQRKRALVAGKWEGPLVTTALLVLGIVFVFLVVWEVFKAIGAL
jgi:hypothetical protein